MDTPPRLGGTQDEEAGDIAAVGVERGGAARLVGAEARAVGRDVDVAHVAQHIALVALRHGGAEMLAEAPIDRARVVFRIALDGKAADHEHAGPMLQRLERARGNVGKPRHRQVFPAHGRQSHTACGESRQAASISATSAGARTWSQSPRVARSALVQSAGERAACRVVAETVASVMAVPPDTLTCSRADSRFLQATGKSARREWAAGAEDRRRNISIPPAISRDRG